MTAVHAYTVQGCVCTESVWEHLLWIHCTFGPVSQPCKFEASSLLSAKCCCVQSGVPWVYTASCTLFRHLGRGSHRLDCSYWLDKLCMSFVMGPEAFLTCFVQYSIPGYFLPPLLHFWVRMPQTYLTEVFFRRFTSFFLQSSYLLKLYRRVYLVVFFNLRNGDGLIDLRVDRSAKLF